MLLTVPAAIGLMALPFPVVQVLFERGQFTTADTSATAAALIAFAVGLPAFVMIKVFSPGFFAREDTRTPMIFAGISVVINVVGSLLLFPAYAQVGIAVATSVAGWVNAGLLAITLARRGQYKPDSKLLRSLPRIFFSALVMGCLLLAAMIWAEPFYTEGWTFLVRIPVLLGLIGVGAVIYFGLCHLTGAARLRELKQSFRRA